MNGTSEMPKRNSSNELPPQNAAGKKKVLECMEEERKIIK